jgi:uncharacterized damage-inducible protein DinB
MNEPVLSAAELLAWLETTAQNWKRLIEKHPESLHLGCDIAGTASVAELLQHIVAVQLRYAERLSALPETSYAEIPFWTVYEIYETHDRAMKMLHGLLSNSDYDWSQEIEFPTRSLGKLAGARRTILFHALLHSIRHYAQLATLVRAHGIKPDWQMDYLMMGVRRIDEKNSS